MTVDELPAYYAKRTLLNEIIYPEDIANGIAFFASPRTRNVTGQILTLDGGRSMGISLY